MGVISARRGNFTPDNRGEQIRRHRPDYILLIITVLLLAVGLIVVFAISPALAVEKHVNGNAYVIRQIIAILLGTIMFGITAHVPLGQWRKLSMALLLAAGVATLMALVMPVNANYPAHRWIRLGGMSFQSVELLKYALIVWLAGFFAVRIKRGEMADMRKTLKPLVFVLLGLGLVVAFIQSDLGSMMVITAMMGIMAFVAGLPMKRILLIGLIIVVGGVLAISAMPYRRARLATFLNPQSNCLTTGYQACQALIAVGSGGMIGLGLGKSVQAYGYLPEAEDDSIFAIYAEKFGLVGSVVLLALFVALFTRIKRIAEHAPNDYSRLVVVGILAWLSTQTLINIGAMVGLLPLKGITLPLISYGGSSVIMVLAALGLVFQVSRYTLHRVPEIGNGGGAANYDNTSDRRRVRGAYHAAPGSRG